MNIKNETALGIAAKQFIDKGEYVPDSLTNSMVAQRISQPDAEPGFLLDGYPRTVSQIEALDAFLDEHHQPIDMVIELTVDMEQLISRLSKRAIEQGRADDTEDVIRHRMEVYLEQTAPVVAVYRERGLLAEVDGLGTIDEVAQRLLAVIGK